MGQARSGSRASRLFSLAERTPNRMPSWEGWRAAVGRLRRDVHAILLACRDPRTPAYAKLIAAGVVAYAVSPIDLIPDFIPVLGHLDDALVIPLGILIVRRLIPREVLEECRARVAMKDADRAADGGPTGAVPP